MLESLLRNVAGLKTCNFIKKRPQGGFFVNVAKFLKLFISKIICERLFFDFFFSANDCFLTVFIVTSAKRFKIYDGVRLQGLIHRSSFLFLSRHEPSPLPRPAFENLRRMPLMNQLSFILVIFGCIR